MNTFCPFIKDNCKPDCVFRIHTTTADPMTQTTCRLVSAAAGLEYLSDVLPASETNPRNPQVKS